MRLNANGRYTTGYCRPLLTHTVMICTAAASLSRRRLRSVAPLRSSRWVRSQSRRAGRLKCSRCAVSCSTCVRCAMSVIWRSPSIHDSTRVPIPVELRGLEDRRDATLPGVVGPLAQRVGDAIGQRVTLGGKGFGGLAEEHRRRRRAHQPGAVRLVECLQQAQPVVGRRRAEHVGVAGVHGGDARGGQRVEARAAVSVGLDDHRDVAGPQRPSQKVAPLDSSAAMSAARSLRNVRAQPVHRDDAILLGARTCPATPPAAGTARCAGRP